MTTYIRMLSTMTYVCRNNIHQELLITYIKMLFVTTIRKNSYICPELENNVEAFRYYLVLKSRQFQPNKIIGKCFLR